MTTASSSDLLTRDEAAAFLRIRPQTLAAWLTTGRYRLPVVRIGRSVRYKLSDLQEFVASRTVSDDAN